MANRIDTVGSVSDGTYLPDIDIAAHLPSRQLEDMLMEKTFNRRSIKQRVTMHHSGRLPDNDKLATKIATVITEDMEGEPDAEQAVVEILRDMTGTTLGMKKKIRKKVRTSGMERHISQVDMPSWYTTKKYEVYMMWQQLRYQLGDVFSYIALWQSSVKTIEGQFGTGVASYFRFMRWLFFINIPVFLLTFCFIIVPNVSGRLFDSNYRATGNGTFTGLELILGTGIFNESDLYYGYYESITIDFIPGLKYHMKYAYLFTSAAYYILCLILLAYSMAKSYRAVYVRGHYDVGLLLMERIFCGWQNGIMSPYASSLHHRSIYNELKEYLSRLMRPVEETRMKERLKLWSIRLVSNFMVLSLISLAAFLVYYVSSRKKTTPITLMYTPFTVCSLLISLPYAITFIGSKERYEKPESELYIGMARTMLQKLSILGVLIFNWFRKLPCASSKGSTNTTSTNGSLNISGGINLYISDKRQCSSCWENEMAQEIYRIVILDFLLILVSTLFLEFAIKHLNSVITKRVTILHFNIGRNTLEIIFSQVLIWIGAFYSPLLSLIMIIKLFLIFYIKRISASMNLSPSDKPWLASRAETVFLAFLFTFFVTALVTIACGIIFIAPSETCGPFKNQDTVYMLVRILIDGWRVNYPWLYSIVEFISSSGFVSATIVFLCIGNYFAWIIKNGHKEMVVSLKDRLTMEGRDKAYLMKRYREINYDLKVKVLAKNALAEDTRNASVCK